MQQFNYVKALGSFLNAMQPITIATEPSDRDGKKMLAAFNDGFAKVLNRGLTRFKSANQGASEADIEAEKKRLTDDVIKPAGEGKISVPLQYLQDYLIRKMASVQNNVSMHDTDSVAELREVLGEYQIVEHRQFKDMTFSNVFWTAKEGQKPKVLLFCDSADRENMCIRFEAAGELAQKILHAVQSLNLQTGSKFSLDFSTEDPAVRRNGERDKLRNLKKSGVISEADEKRLGGMGNNEKEGVFVNHNMLVTAEVGGQVVTHTGKPPKGTPFVQKMTVEAMEALYKSVARGIVRAPAGSGFTPS